MNQNPLEEDKQEIHKNPEVTKLCSSLVHHLGHFILLSRMRGEYTNFIQLEHAREFIGKLLDVSKNPLLISCLKQLQEKLNEVKKEREFDTALIDAVDEIYSPIFSHTLEQY